MKRFVIAMVLVMISVPAFAGIGFHFNYDMVTIDEEVAAIEFDNDVPGSFAMLGREEMKSAIGGGIDISIGMIPVIDLMISLEGAYGTYKSGYTSGVGSVIINNEEEDIPFLRIGADVTASMTVFPFPGIGGVYVGAGPSFMAVAPIFSEDLIKDNVDSANAELDVAGIADDIQMEFGLHLAAGVKLKPVGFPLAFRVGAKYYIIPTFEDPAPTNWLTVQAGFSLGG